MGAALLPWVRLGEEDAPMLCHIGQILQSLHVRSVQAAAAPTSVGTVAKCHSNESTGDAMCVEASLSGPVEPSEQLQREAEDAVVQSAMDSIGDAASPEAVQRANDSAYSNLLDPNMRTEPVGDTHQAGRPPADSLLSGGAVGPPVGGVASSASVPAPAATPVVFGPGGSSGTLPTRPLHLADTLMAIHNSGGANGIRRVIDEVSTNETGLGQAEAKQSRV